MPFTQNELLFTLALPAAVTLIAAVLALWPARPASEMRLGLSLTTILCLGAVIAMLAAQGIPWKRPILAENWITLVVVPAALLLGVLRDLPMVPAMIVWVLRVVIAFGLSPLILQPFLHYHWQSTAEKLAWIVGIGIVLLALWFATRLAAGKQHGRAALLVTSLSLAVLGAIAAASGSVSTGRDVGAISMVVGMTWLAWVTIGRSTAGGVVDIATILLMAMTVYTVFYVDNLYLAQGVLILLAPCGVVMLRCRVMGDHRPLLRAAVSSLLVAVLLAGAVGFAVKANLDMLHGPDTVEDDSGIDYSDVYGY